MSGLRDLLPVIYKELQNHEPFTDTWNQEIFRGFTVQQTKEGLRESKLFSRLELSQVPDMRDSTANEALKKIFDFKTTVFNEVVEPDPLLHSLKAENKIEQVLSFHTYKKSHENEQGFEAHIDYGLVAIVFTMGRDFQYSEDGGLNWKNLSDHEDVNEDTVIINFGRIYSTLTGTEPVLHRVTATGSLNDNEYPDNAKFTIGFFNEIKGDVQIPAEIPAHIQNDPNKALHLANWRFLSTEVRNIGEYNLGRLDGTIREGQAGKIEWRSHEMDSANKIST